MSSPLRGESLARVLWRLHGVTDSSPITSLVLNDCEVANRNKATLRMTLHGYTGMHV